MRKMRFVNISGVLGTACFICKLARCPHRWHLGHSKTVYPSRHHRGGFFSFPLTQMVPVRLVAFRNGTESN